ncbi:MAG: flagellar biosynthesis protein FlhB [Clostridiales bacterium]|nr:flagellar biosynthesis protein FlhB [Clostridiales bacterium]
MDKYYLFPYNLQFFAEGADKTEQPTAKKLLDARKEGQVAKSKELTTAVELVALFLTLKLFVGYIRDRLIENFNNTFNNMDMMLDGEFTISKASKVMNDSILRIIITCLPIFAVAVGVSFTINLYQVKWQLSGKPLSPKFSKMNPVSGFKKIFSKDKLFSLLVEIVKIFTIIYIAYNTLKSEWNTLLVLYDINLIQAIALIGKLVMDLGLKISMFFLILGLGDYIYQKLKFNKDMRMTKQEVKDEFKQSEGDPQVKGKIRSKMREASQRRMMQRLPEADVVITNPTHFAAAIKYDKDTSEAPILIAKGADYLANKIKEVARENQIEIVENKPLARMLYYNVEVGGEIPPELYQMTAEVLAYVYKLKGKI